MYVPPEQVIDTVDLFRLPRQRLIALRFLAGCLLGQNIQSETHDSIEDARTALLLYKKYRDLQAENKFDAVLQGIYQQGHASGWKIVKPSSKK